MTFLLSLRLLLDFLKTLYLSNFTFKIGKNTISQSSSVGVISEYVNSVTELR